MRRELTPSRGHVGMLAREARPPPCPDPPLRLLETRATVSCDYCMPDRMRMPITVCRGLAVPIREFWPKDKLDLRPARLRARAARPGRELGGCVALSHDHFEG